MAPLSFSSLSPIHVFISILADSPPLTTIMYVFPNSRDTCVFRVPLSACGRDACLAAPRYCRLAGQLAGGDDGAAFPNADRALFQAINNAAGAGSGSGADAAGQARRWVERTDECLPPVSGTALSVL